MCVCVGGGMLGMCVRTCACICVYVRGGVWALVRERVGVGACVHMCVRAHMFMYMCGVLLTTSSFCNKFFTQQHTRFL